MAEYALKTIGKYEIEAEVGRGAMGEVYKARDPLIGRMVALKVITSGLTNKPELLERFYQEARSAGALQHPNIVTVYELGKEGDLPFIAMEYLGGESLEKLIARQAPLPLAQKVGYIVQICRALEYAHKHGVVHRDIKPGNIMGTSEGTVKVVDFGIARLVDASKTQTGTLIGTLGYMSPQQLRGEHADERSDIWAAGVLLYELLSYKRPFRGDNPAAMMMAIISEQPASLMEAGADCTPEVEAIIFRMLQKEAGDRYQTMDEVLLDLDPVYKQLQHSRVGELVEQSQRLIDADDLKSAQRLLREALHADSSRVEAKTLLDKVSRELRRQLVLPKVKEQVAKAQGMLDAGQLQEAKAEVQSALHIDSTFQPARELLGEVQRAVEGRRELDKKLRATKQRIAEGSLTDADRQLDDVLSLDPENPQAQQLRRQIREELGRREQRTRLSEAVRHARDLWSQLRYADCIVELVALQKDHPDNIEIAKLLETARRDQTETEKQKKLAEIRNLLASGQHEQARGALAALEREYPEDAAVQNLLTLALDEQGTAARQERLQQELGRLRSLAAEGKHAEALAGGERLLGEFPGEFELVELVKFSRAEVERSEDARLLGDAIGRVRELLAKNAFAEAAQAAEAALAEYPGNADLAALRAEAEEKQQKTRRREQIEKRIREVQSKITQNELTDAIELARETIATLGPDTNVRRLLEMAEVERKQREKKKEQDQRVGDARSLLDAGKLDEATQILDEALATQLLDAADPRVKPLLAEVEKKKRETRAAPPPAAAESRLAATPAADTAAAAKEHARAAKAAPGSGRKTVLVVAAGIVIVTAVGVGFYFESSRNSAPAPPATATAQPPASTASQPSAPVTTTTGQPATPPATSHASGPPSAPAPAENPAKQPSQPVAHAAKPVVPPPQPAARKAAKPGAPRPSVAKPQPNASAELQELIRKYNVGTDDPAALRKLQNQFRGLEKAGGTIGRQARRYAERRIPADLKDLETTAAMPAPVPPKAAATAPARVPAQRYLWAVAVDSTSVKGVQPKSHPLPIALVAKAAASHSHFELQLSVNSQGRVTAGRVLSGDPALGRTLVSDAVKSWRFSAPGGNGATVKLAVEF